jgi:hypothetical protein
MLGHLVHNRLPSGPLERRAPFLAPFMRRMLAALWRRH